MKAKTTIDGRTYQATEQADRVYVRGPLEWGRPMRATFSRTRQAWVEGPERTITGRRSRGRAVRQPEFWTAAYELVERLAREVAT